MNRQSLVKYDLGWNTRIGTTKNGGKRMLAVCQFRSPLCRLTGMLQIAAGITAITFLELGDCLGGSDAGCSGWPGSAARASSLMASKLDATKQHANNFFVITDLGALGESSQFGTAINEIMSKQARSLVGINRSETAPTLQPAFLRLSAMIFNTSGL